MLSLYRNHRLIFILLVLIAAMGTTTSAVAANYYGITVNYNAYSGAHYGNHWLSWGHVDTDGTVVDQIGSTFWSTMEYCDDVPNYSRFYSFNGSKYYQNHTYTRSFFRTHVGCDPGDINEFRTYIRFYIQDWPNPGKEFPDTHWATWLIT